MLLDLLYQGGPFFMYSLLLILIVILILIAKGFISKKQTEKTISLIGSFALFAIVWGFLGQVIGLVAAFDAIEAAGDVSPGIMAGGLKVSFLAPLFGMVIFLAGRAGIIALTWIRKE